MWLGSTFAHFCEEAVWALPVLLNTCTERKGRQGGGGPPKRLFRRSFPEPCGTSLALREKAKRSHCNTPVVAAAGASAAAAAAGAAGAAAAATAAAADAAAAAATDTC